MHSRFFLLQLRRSAIILDEYFFITSINYLSLSLFVVAFSLSSSLVWLDARHEKEGKCADVIKILKICKSDACKLRAYSDIGG